MPCADLHGANGGRFYVICQELLTRKTHVHSFLPEIREGLKCMNLISENA